RLGSAGGVPAAGRARPAGQPGPARHGRLAVHARAEAARRRPGGDAGGGAHRGGGPARRGGCGRVPAPRRAVRLTAFGWPSTVSSSTTSTTPGVASVKLTSTAAVAWRSTLPPKVT